MGADNLRSCRCVPMARLPAPQASSAHPPTLPACEGPIDGMSERRPQLRGSSLTPRLPEEAARAHQARGSGRRKSDLRPTTDSAVPPRAWLARPVGVLPVRLEPRRRLSEPDRCSRSRIDGRWGPISKPAWRAPSCFRFLHSGEIARTCRNRQRGAAWFAVRQMVVSYSSRQARRMLSRTG
jgi:hypothetical protein